MPIHDVSMRIRPGMLAWPGSSTPRQGWDTRLDRGEESNASNWFLNSHSGTHIDAPGHFIPGGALLSDLPLDLFVGPAEVVELPEEVVAIDAAVVRARRRSAPARLLFKTSNSARRLDRDQFDPGYVAFTPDGARALVEAGVKLLGIDYLSVERYGDAAFPVHRILLGAGIPLIEGLDLRGVPPGRYQLHCLPLRLEGSEAAPARVILSRQPRLGPTRRRA
jgi:arylformamidase